MNSFDLQPYVGALPVRFGMFRRDVRLLFRQPPKTCGQQRDDWFGPIRIGYEQDAVVEMGFGPGDCALQFCGQELWTPGSQPDPLPLLLRHDPEPLELHGFLVFRELGMTVTGYHDDDPGQRAITCFIRGRWDSLLPRCKRPDLTRYLQGGGNAT
jgi:hypothetical protein